MMSHKASSSHKAFISQEDFKMVGNWDGQSQLLKEKFPQLTKADLVFEKGHENDLLERIQKRLNKGQSEVINIIRKGQTPGERKTSSL